MPYNSIEAAKEAGFPTTAEGINLTLAQINKLASIYDAVKATGTAENAMAVAWTQWKALYLKEGDEWVLRKSEFTDSAVFAFDSINFNSEWIPVASVGQKTKLANGKTISLSREALESNIESWKGGYINVNHEDNGEIEDFIIEDAKFEGGLLYHKVNSKVAEFILNQASNGRSIEIDKMKLVNDVVMSYNGLGLAVLYPPLIPSCTEDMGCTFSNKDTGVGTLQDRLNNKDTENQSAVRAIFTKLAEKLKSQSFMDSMNETSGTDPNLETTMTEETDTLKFGKMEAEKSRDEAKEEVKTLKFSLVEKDTALKEKESIISDKDTLITEQTERLKLYADAETTAADKLKEERWEIIKFSLPAGKIHKPEDEAALKEEYFEDPEAFAVTQAQFKREDPRGESGAEYPGDSGNTYLADRAEFDAGTGGK